MTHSSHPFSSARLSAVADEYEVNERQLDEALTRIQTELERPGGGYEYTPEFNFGWQDDHASYFYGSDELWEWVQQQVSLPEELRDPVREVHYRTMLDAAAERDEKNTVAEMFANGNEPLVVINTSQGPPSFGQGDSV